MCGQEKVNKGFGSSILQFYDFGNRISSNKELLLCAIATLVAVCPYLINGSDYVAVIHDNLDANVTFLTSLSEKHFFSFSPDVYVDGIMLNTIPRNNFPDSIKISPLLFWLFNPHLAYILNLALHKFLVIVSFYLFTRDYVFNGHLPFVNLTVAITYAFLPTYAIYGPGNLCVFFLMLWASFKYIDTHRPAYLLLFSVIPFTTSLVFFDLFVLPVLLLVLVLFGKLEIKQIYRLVVPFSIFVLFVVLTNSNTLFSFFFPTEGFISHRLEFVKDKLTIAEALSRSIKYFFYGFYHAPSAPKFIAIGLVLYLALKAFYSGLKDPMVRTLTALFILQICLALVYGFWFWEGLLPIKLAIPLLNLLDMTRLAFLAQPIWYMILALIIYDAIQMLKRPFNYAIITLVLFIQFAYVYLHNREVQANFKNALGLTVNKKEFESIDDYYQSDLFDRIKHDFPDIRDSWTLTIGEDPAVSRFNDLNVLDYYYANYDLNYKHRFESMIRKELEKDSLMSDYFHHYGSRCYAFSAQLFDNPDIDSNTRLSLAYDWEVFKEMKGKYVVSFYPISDDVLFLLKKYAITEDSRHQSIFLYQCTL